MVKKSAVCKAGWNELVNGANQPQAAVAAKVAMRLGELQSEEAV